MVATPLWDARRKAEVALDNQLRPFAALLSEAFAATDRAITRLENRHHQFGQVCALVLIKGRNLGLGCYSLSLDALAQEAGALFRPLIECLELLIYFRLDPARVNEALEDRLPKAGVIASQIEGKFKGLREYLNAHASHLSLSPEAMMHLIDFKGGRLRFVQGHNDAVLRENLRTLLAVAVWLATEAANCTSVGEGTADHELVGVVEDLRRRAFLLLDNVTAQ